jgi:hypothetical protein
MQRIQALPGVLRHSVKLRTLPQDTSLRDRVEKSCWTSLAWFRRLQNTVDHDNVLFLKASLKLEVTSHASELPAFVYLKCAGKQRYVLIGYIRAREQSA